MTVLALLVEGLPPRLTVENGAGFLYPGVVGTTLAYALWFRGIERLPASATSFLSLMSPLSESVLGFVVLEQAYTTWQGAGAALVIAAVLLGQIGGAGRGKAGAPSLSHGHPRSSEHPRSKAGDEIVEDSAVENLPRAVRATNEERGPATVVWTGYPAQSSQTLVWTGYQPSSRHAGHAGYDSRAKGADRSVNL